MQQLWLIALVWSFTSTAFASAKCQTYKDKFKAIQQLQKQPHSAKRSVNLHQREQKAWQLWMDCKNGKLKKKRTAKKSKLKKAKPSTPVTNKRIITPYAGSAFQSQQAIVMKAKYQGAKQQAWLNYYQPPEKCRKPKSTQVFAFCLAQRDEQQLAFEAQYSPP